jgi:hypothetical protein
MYDPDAFGDTVGITAGHLPAVDVGTERLYVHSLFFICCAILSLG